MISAVICELNPLHLGHRHILQKAGEVGGVVAILSGNFVQRGEPAILDKWARCRAALRCGADLVIELPLPWAMAGAERFASGGVALADALGCVDALVFGSECPDVSLLHSVAEALLSPAFSEKLKALPDAGEGFAVRRERALADMLGESVVPILRSPNATLGVEYIKASLRQGAQFDIRAVQREPGFLSSTQIREKLRAGEDLTGLVSEPSRQIIEEERAAGRCPVDITLLEWAILCKLRTLSAQELADLPDISEGLENRLYAAARKAGTLEELYNYVKSKRYPLARARRLALSAFLGLTKDLPALPPYLRVLGMTGRGEEILKAAKPKLPLVTRPADVKKLSGPALEVFRLEALADDLYALAAPVPQPCGRDLTEKLIRV